MDITLDDTQPTEEALDILEHLYYTSFPPDERREWETIVRPESADGPRITTVMCDNTPVGLLTWWEFSGFIYIEHFAIKPDLRSLGIGGKALDIFCDRVSPLPVVLEAEPPKSSREAQRRIAFYERHGFTIASTDYVQPPYHDGLKPVHLNLLANAQIKVEHTISTLHKYVYGKY